MNDEESMRILQGLDEGTEWESDGEMLSDNDPDDDGGLATVPSKPHLHPITGGASSEVDSMERAANSSEIISTIRDMNLNGAIEDLMVVINTPDGEQILLTTLNRNDHIIGMLTVATMNWHSSQIAASNFYDEDEEV